MFNGLTKTALAAIVFFSAGCKSGGDSTSQATAEKLLTEANEAFEGGNYEWAMELMDSIDRSCPEAIEARRQATLLRPQVLERLSAKELSRCDSLLAENQLRGDSLKQLVRLIATPTVEPYYVAQSETADNPRSTAGLHSRMSQDYHFYICATSARPVGEEASLWLTTAGDTVHTEAIARDGERNAPTAIGDMLTLTEAESTPLAEFVARHRNEPITATFRGPNQTSSIALDDKQVNAIATLHELSRTIANDRYLRLEIERLSKQLQLSRQQTMDMIPD